MTAYVIFDSKKSLGILGFGLDKRFETIRLRL